MSSSVTANPVTKFSHRKRRHPRFAAAASASRTFHHGATFAAYGSTSTAASGPGQLVKSSRTPATR